MRRVEAIALRSRTVNWERLVKALPAALEAIGLVHDDAATDGQLTVYDHGEGGCVVLLDRAALARRAALALSTRTSAPVEVFEVIATSGGKRFRFRTAAFRATAAGELKDAEGPELPLEEPEETWGGGDLEAQAARVLQAYAGLEGGAVNTHHMGYRKRPKGRPSTPRIATLLASLQKAKSHQAVPTDAGRVELRIELAAGGKQISFCSAAELEELEKLL